MAFHFASKSDPSPRRTISWSISHQRRCQLDDHFIDRLDKTEVLGGEDSHGHHIGHTGCVNALSWSPSGQVLASGSDDRNVVLWKLDSEHIHPVAESSTASRTRSSSSARYNVGASRRDRREQPSSSAATQEESESPQSGPVEGYSAITDDGGIVQAWPQRNYPKMGLGMLSARSKQAIEPTSSPSNGHPMLPNAVSSPALETLTYASLTSTTCHRARAMLEEQKERHAACRPAASIMYGLSTAVPASGSSDVIEVEQSASQQRCLLTYS
ncbi:WD40 repeat [Kalmanozyma brasiliensis GHG001]|uniref:WD40 repeat n=1 Tax=Kalmanozyma brasiliensis (strain GHG001) TaxID=1365824 RepID=UPI0028681CB3|nr:WD40 repeat [Kalmanozyma brasiliensis GHG001]KAF6766904.1 WD40 repeat [Kalmanozyma brasiliensis GHG001]